MRLASLAALSLLLASAADAQFARVTDAVQPLGATNRPEQSTFVPFEGEMVFRGIDDSGDIALWTTDGTDAGTAPLVTTPGAPPDNPSAPFTVLDGDLYFSGLDASGDNLLWLLSPGGGIPERVLTGGATHVAGTFARVDDVAYFTACTDDEGCEPWTTNGQSSALLQDVRPGPGSSDARGYTPWQGAVYFTADGADQQGREPWRTVGTAGTTTLLIDLYRGSTSSRVQGFFGGSDGLYFVGEGREIAASTTRPGLWRSSGVPGDTSLVVSGGLLTSILGEVDGTILLAYPDDAVGIEPHRVSGNSAVLLADINPGSVGSLGGPVPTRLAFDDQFVFTAQSRDGFFQVDQIWMTDGATATQITVPDAPSPASYTKPVVLDGALYFMVRDRGTGTTQPDEAWRIEAPGADPERVGALPDGLEVTDWVPAGDRLLASVALGLSETELWTLTPPPPVATEASPEAALDLCAFPSPTSGPVSVRFSLADSGDARVTVHDALGREVARLADGPHASGEHTAIWTPEALASGVYLVRLASGAGAVTQTVVVTR